MTPPVQADEGFVDALASGVHDTKNTLFDALSRIAAVRQALPPESGDSAALLSEAAGAIERSADRLAQILSAYRLIRHENPVALLPTPLRDLAEYVRLRVQPEWTGTASLEVAPVPDELWIMDRELIADCLVNALLNAARQAHTSVTLAFAVCDDWLEVRVDDDGPGYPPEILAGAAPRGSVGLFLADRLAGLHRRAGRLGRLELSNHPEGGARFRLMLP